MEAFQTLLQGRSISQFLLSILRRLLPSLSINVGCTFIIYTLLSSHFPASSIIPLVVASLFLLASNSVSILRHRRLALIGILVLMGFRVSISGVLLGGS